MADPDRSPVIIGVGEVCDRPATHSTGLTTPALIVAAVRMALQDARIGTPQTEIDRVAVVDALSREDRFDPLHSSIVGMLGLTPHRAESSPSPSGHYPIRFLEEAANAIVAGEAECALIAGGEAMRTFARRPAQQLANGSEVIRRYRDDREIDLLQRHGLLTPMDVYPLYEHATRHAWRQTFAEAEAESGAIWAANARVAAENPYAWLRHAPTAKEIVTPSPNNPIVSYPYTRNMVANSGVNQGAAVIVASVTKARALGIPSNRWVHVGYGAAADEPSGNLDRRDFIRSPAMEVSICRALEANALSAGDLDHVELYSCFPCVPKMARRILDWPLDRPHSIYGGLTFGGGPIGNCMSHAIAALVRRIRAGSRNGFIFANGGFATRNHSIVLTRDAPAGGREVRSPDFQAEADAIRGLIPRLRETYKGGATLETFSMPWSKDGPRHATIVALTPEGERILARVPGTDAGGLARLASSRERAVGAWGEVSPQDDGFNHWQWDNR